jgi:hypothetical protein
MDDIRADLNERLPASAGDQRRERAFDQLVVELKREHDNALQHMRAQLRCEQAARIHGLAPQCRTVLAAHIAAAEAAENSIVASLKAGAETPRPA